MAATMESVGLIAGRVTAAIGLFLFPLLLLYMIFALTSVYFVTPVILSFVVILIGLIPDAITKYRARKSAKTTEKALSFVVAKDAENGMDSDTNINSAMVFKSNSIVRCVLVYVVFVVALGIAALVMLHRYTLWSFEDASIAMLYLPEADVQGSSMGVHVRVPEQNTNAHFHISYWPTDRPDRPTTTEDVALNVTQGGTADVVLMDLEPDMEYSYQVAVQKDSGSLFDLRDDLAGSFRALPALTNETLTFVSTSCMMLQMSLGRQATVFKEMLGKGAQLGLFVGDFIYLDVPWGDEAGPGEEWKLQNRYRHMFSEKEVRNTLGSLPFTWMFDDHEITDNYESTELTDTYTRAITEWRAFIGDRNPHNQVTDINKCVLALTTNSNSTNSPEQIQANCEAAFKQHSDRMSFQRADHFDFRTGPARFFVVDTRRFFNNDTMLGADQTADVVKWIRAASTETVSFLVSPTPWTLNYSDGWRCCEPERNAILDAVEDVKREKGVTFVFISGDQHLPGIYELRPGVFEVSASPLDAVTTQFTSALESFGFVNEEIDRVVFEQAGYNHVFALWSVNATHVGVGIYAGGQDFAAVMGVCLLGILLFLALLAWGYGKPKQRNVYVLASICVALLVGLVVLAVVTVFGLDEPMFSFDIER